MITIKNIKTEGTEWDDIAIHRGSILGNPYSFKESNFNTIACSTREEAIEKYREYFHEQIVDVINPAFWDYLNMMIIMNLKGEDIKLSCYCHPKPCHGSIIKEYVESQKFCRNWFSNMFLMESPIVYEGCSYHTVESFYQAMKTNEHETRKNISNMTSFASKKFMQGKEPRKGFEKNKLKFMKYALQHKFAHGTPWRKRLDSTKGHKIIEWNNWNDTFWGKNIFNKKGENNLGKLLMEIRDN
jgi:ribA/ribD-fused uncharacterized protein